MAHALPQHVRAAITAELTMLFDRVDVLIARLDSDDEDPDLEEDDHSGDPLETNGEAFSDDGAGILPQRPLYGIDQAAGPINHIEAQTSYLASENGLERIPNGWWRRAA